ncbi:MAG: alanine racemase [Treponema sp.]|nr:alanine racemase [Treponema sp.]
MRATRAFVYLNRFRENIRAVAGLTGKRKICVPVKADAYGHGALPLARAALEAGADFLAVALVQEGEELRRGGIQAPILLFSQCSDEELGDLAEHNLSPFVSGPDYIDALAQAARAAGKELQVHLKVDTGMGRAGCRPEDAAALAGRVLSRGNLRLAGVATHLAVSDSRDGAGIAYTGDQLRRFNEAVKAIRAAGIDPGILHAANSGGVLYHPDSWFDMVRPGILLYGYGPLPSGPGGQEAASAASPCQAGIAVRPLMELRSKVAAVKPVRKGESVSYGREWTAAKDTLAALVPAGYADGLRRGLSGRWRVGIRGRTYPVIGRICMDQCLVDLGAADYSAGYGVAKYGGAGYGEIVPGDEVLLFGENPAKYGGAAFGDAKYGDAACMAEKLGTIPHEITCGIGKRVPRIYLDKDPPAGC